MHPTTQEKAGSSIKLSELADQINNEFRNSNSLAVEAIKSGSAAVKSALRAGSLLTKAKRAIEHGNWLKWLDDNCPDISPETARKWMALSNSNHGLNLAEATSLRKAYLAVGILHEASSKRKPIGTAPVDIFADLFAKFNRGLGPVIEIASDIEVSDMPQEMRAKLLERAEPVVGLIERIKAIDERRGLEVG